jgi:hypothetical protein
MPLYVNNKGVVRCDLCHNKKSPHSKFVSAVNMNVKKGAIQPSRAASLVKAADAIAKARTPPELRRGWTGLNLGCAPTKEQVSCFGLPKYLEKVEGEMVVWRETLVKMFGQPPTGAWFGIMSEKKFGGKEFNVGIFSDDANGEAVQFAHMVLTNLPETWSEANERISRQEGAGVVYDEADSDCFIVGKETNFGVQHGIAVSDPDFHTKLAAWARALKPRLRPAIAGTGWSIRCAGCNEEVKPRENVYYDGQDTKNHRAYFCKDCGDAIVKG